MGVGWRRINAEGSTQGGIDVGVFGRNGSASTAAAVAGVTDTRGMQPHGP